MSEYVITWIGIVIVADNESLILKSYIMGAAGNKKPKGMKKKHEASYMAEDSTKETFLKKGKKK